MQGRILVFAVKDFKLQLICEREVKGAVYNVNAFQVISLSLSSCLWTLGSISSQIVDPVLQSVLAISVEYEDLFYLLCLLRHVSAHAGEAYSGNQ